MYSLIVRYKHRHAWHSSPVMCTTCHQVPKCSARLWMSHMDFKSSIAIVTKQKAPSPPGRKGSFEGHWSGSYCPEGRQIGPVKPHCENDWNWFVVLLLHHPIKRRNLRERGKRERMRENESKKSLAWPWHVNGASEAGKKLVFLAL